MFVFEDINVYYLSLLVTIIIFTVFVYVLTCTKEMAYKRYECERYFYDPISDSRATFPSSSAKPDIDLSVIVPAYNEGQRISVMLDETLEVLENKQKTTASFSFEIIIVDDGSKDNTYEIALKYSAEYGTDKVRVLKLKENRGKGGAIRLGMLSGRGERLLFADADGASKFSDFEKLNNSMDNICDKQNNLGVVCGSRAHLEKESIATRSFFRTFLMMGFHLFVSYVGSIRGIRDTQCGFKLFTRHAAQLCFHNMHIERWAFDVDLLYICQRLNIPTSEVAINWQEIDGSKLNPITSSIEMAFDLMLIRFKYMFGLWTISKKFKDT